MHLRCYRVMHTIILSGPLYKTQNYICSHRDLNPSCGVESPTSLAGLDDRSALNFILNHR